MVCIPIPFLEITVCVNTSKVKFPIHKPLGITSNQVRINQKALDDLANLDRFKAMSWALKNSKDYYYYGDKNTAGLPLSMTKVTARITMISITGMILTKILALSISCNSKS